MFSPITSPSNSYNLYSEDVAIIGIDCLLPDSCGAEELWQDLKYGRDHLSEFPAERRAFAEAYARWLGKPSPVLRKGNYLRSIAGFDYRFFHISPKEAALMNPNQRLLLQTVYRTFQDAGISEERIKGSDTGLYIGYIGDYDGSLYSHIANETQPEPSPTGSLASMNAGRISYLLDLHGPAVMIDTACSSSLVALYQAYRAIRCGECRMAVAAGVRTTLMPDSGHSIGIESSDGVTRAFDRDADGTGIGEGVAAVLLKPLHEAVKDHDMIYAVIKGGAVNQDGTGIGLTAPNVNAQIEVLKAAWRNAGISPQDLSYIEAHGTGTRLGDPIEADGLNKAFRSFTDECNFCAIGSVKSNYGHLYDCAGILGVIKTALMLKHRTIVPTVNFHTLNPGIDLKDSPLRIASQLTAWEPRNGTRLAGVSAFGFSGTNCHIVLAECPEAPADSAPPPGNICLFTASAKSPQALYRLLDAYRVLTHRLTDRSLSALCMSTQLDRSHYRHRVAIPVRSMEELRERLEVLCDYQIADEPHSPAEGIYFGLADQEGLPQLSTEPESLAQQYVTYSDVDFEPLYYHRTKYRMRLPLYPFAQEHCWIRIPDARPRLTGEDPSEAQPTSEPGVTLTGDPDGCYSETERYLASVFAEKLGYHELSVNDDIYALGGDSIIAYQIVNRVNSDLATALTMADILEHRTIRRIAAHIDRSASSGKSIYRIQKAEPAQRYPLSYAQQRMYFLYLLEPENTSYNMPFLLRIRGALDTGRFEKACRELVRLHDVFRTHFAVENGEAVQWVSETGELEFTHLYGTPDAETIQQLRRPFDLGSDVLIRTFLFHVREGEEYLALIDMNHISADGSSLGILISELTALYQGQQLEKAEIQYTDFAVWQRALDLKPYEEYWLAKLQHYPEYELPIDHLRNREQNGTCEICAFRLSGAQYQALRALCIEQKIGVFSFLFSAYQASLAAFANVDEVISGTPISGRTAIETQNMVGMFVNVMPLRTAIDRGSSFRGLTQAVHTSILEMLEYQDYPFDLLVDRLNVQRKEGRNPIYDTVFAFQNMHIPAFRAEGLEVEMTNEDNISKFDITVEAMERLDQLEITFKYDTALFEETTILQFMDILRNGLEQAIAAPDTEVGTLFARQEQQLEDSGFEEIDFDF